MSNSSVEAIPVAYAIDFGTTNSAVAVVFDDGTVALPPDSVPMQRTLLYINRTGNQLIGDDAVRNFVTAAGASTQCRKCSLVEWDAFGHHTDCREFGTFCYDARLIQHVKSSLADESFSKTHSWAQDFSIEELVGSLLKLIKKQCDEMYRCDVRRVVIGHPVRFSGAEGPGAVERQALALERLETAARFAGFTEAVEFAEESRAAIVTGDLPEGVVLCVDFGGGTFDCAVAEVVDSHTEVLALNGTAIGGDAFDSYLFENWISRHIGVDRRFPPAGHIPDRIPAQIRSKLTSFEGVAQLQRSHLFAGVDAELRNRGGDETLDAIQELIYGGQTWRLFESIREAKHALSEADETILKFSSPNLKFEIPVTRREFEDVVTNDLQQTMRSIDGALKSARVASEDVCAISVTGGSSSIPLFRQLLAQKFPDAQIIEMDAYLTVVGGLASLASERFANG